jgi:hypothetical protein
MMSPYLPENKNFISSIFGFYFAQPPPYFVQFRPTSASQRRPMALSVLALLVSAV